MEGSITIGERLRAGEYGVNKNRTDKRNYVDGLVIPVVAHGSIIQLHLDRISRSWLKRASTTANRNGKDRLIVVGRIVLMRVSGDPKVGIHTCGHRVIVQLK